MENLTSVSIYAGTIGIIAAAMVNPSNKGLAQEWKALTLFGIIPSMIKLASMTGEAQLAPKVILFACAVTVVIHLILRTVSEKYKMAFKNPSQVTPGEAVMTWTGVTLVYALSLTGALLLFKNKYNGGSIIKTAAPTPSAPSMAQV
jgi:EamA domain-containing membrane protein RarD